MAQKINNTSAYGVGDGGVAGTAAGISTSPRPLVALLRSCPLIVLHIVSFLPTQDLHAVDGTGKEFNSFIAEQDKILFTRRLQDDFYEGKVLVQTVETALASCTVNSYGGAVPTTPYKKMYLAFRNRFQLHAGNKHSVTIPWQSPSTPLPGSLFNTTLSAEIVDKFYDFPDYERAEGEITNNVKITDEVNALVFIFRIGQGGNAVGLMEWVPWNNDGEKLVINKKQQNCDDWLMNFDIPKLDDEAIEMIGTYEDMDIADTVPESAWENQPEKVKSKLSNLFCFSLTVIDVQRFQAMEIMKDQPAGDLELDKLDHSSSDRYTFVGTDMKAPYLVGVDPESYDSEDQEGNPDFDAFHQFGSLLKFDKSDYPRVYLEDMNIHLSDPMAGRDLYAYQACHLYRALMKRKCVDIGGFPTFSVATTLHRRESQDGHMQSVRRQLQLSVAANKITTDQRGGDETNGVRTDTDATNSTTAKKRKLQKVEIA